MKITKFSTLLLLAVLSSCLVLAITYQLSYKTAKQVLVSLVIKPRVLNAVVDINPDTLNLKSRGQWITAYIQLPEEYNPEDIDAATILLNETVRPVLDPKYEFVTNSNEYIVDHDGDGALERMVKFNRTEVASWIYDDLGIKYGNVTLTITGELFDGTPFEGTDMVKVLFPARARWIH